MIKLKNKKTIACQTVVLAALIILIALVLIPFWLMIVKSFKSFMQEVDAPLALTFPIAWENY